MRVARRAVLAALIASVALIGAVGPALAAGDEAPRSEPAAAPQVSPPSDEASTINVTQEFSLTPSRPGEVTVELRFSIPGRIISLRTEVPADANVTGTNGFRREANETYSWDGTTFEPSLTYSLPVNESLNDTTPEGADGELVAVDAGEWALFQRPPTRVHWQNYAAEEPIEYDRTSSTDGPGATGEWLVFLGEHDSYERATSDQRFRLVVPANADMTDHPATVLDSLEHASETLRVGARDGEVFVVAAPTDDVQWGVRGLQTGQGDLWVRDVETVTSPENPWVHEYVHSRQDFSLGSDMRWFREASASYYAALLTYEQSHIRYDGFSDRIGTGANGSYAGAVLANQSTWATNPAYDKGALVTGQIDRQIRTAQDQERTLQTVFRTMNAAQGRITLDDFLAYLRDHGDDSVVAAGERYAGTDDNVTMWNQTAHVMAFGDPPARFRFQFPNESNGGTYDVRGPYRTATVDAGDDPLVLVPGEQLRVAAPVTNTGGRTGTYTASLVVNGSIADRTRGSAAPNETATAVLNHTFAKPGTYALTLGNDIRTVEVREPAEATVTDLTAPAREIRAGETVEVSATVENHADVPGEATVVFRRDDGRFATKTARVGPNDAVRVNTSVPMASTGTTAVSVDSGGSVSLTVRPQETPTATSTPDTPSPTPTATDTPNRNATESIVSSDSESLVGGIAVTLAVAVTAGLVLYRERG